MRLRTFEAALYKSAHYITLLWNYKQEYSDTFWLTVINVFCATLYVCTVWGFLNFVPNGYEFLIEILCVHCPFLSAAEKICHIRCDKLVIDSFSSLLKRRENLRHLCNSMTDLRTIWHDDAEQVYRPVTVLTRSCARPTADGPRDAMRHSKFCQPLHNSLGTSCITNPEKKSKQWS